MRFSILVSSALAALTSAAALSNAQQYQAGTEFNDLNDDAPDARLAVRDEGLPMPAGVAPHPKPKGEGSGADYFKNLFHNEWKSVFGKPLPTPGSAAAVNPKKRPNNRRSDIEIDGFDDVDEKDATDLENEPHYAQHAARDEGLPMHEGVAPRPKTKGEGGGADYFKGLFHNEWKSVFGQALPTAGSAAAVNPRKHPHNRRSDADMDYVDDGEEEDTTDREDELQYAQHVARGMLAPSMFPPQPKTKGSEGSGADYFRKLFHNEWKSVFGQPLPTPGSAARVNRHKRLKQMKSPIERRNVDTEDTSDAEEEDTGYVPHAARGLPFPFGSGGQPPPEFGPPVGDGSDYFKDIFSYEWDSVFGAEPTTPPDHNKPPKGKPHPAPPSHAKAPLGRPHNRRREVYSDNTSDVNADDISQTNYEDSNGVSANDSGDAYTDDTNNADSDSTDPVYDYVNDDGPFGYAADDSESPEVDPSGTDSNNAYSDNGEADANNGDHYNQIYAAGDNTDTYPADGGYSDTVSAGADQYNNYYDDSGSGGTGPIAGGATAGGVTAGGATAGGATAGGAAAKATSAAAGGMDRYGADDSGVADPASCYSDTYAASQADISSGYTDSTAANDEGDAYASDAYTSDWPTSTADSDTGYYGVGDSGGANPAAYYSDALDNSQNSTGTDFADTTGDGDGSDPYASDAYASDMPDTSEDYADYGGATPGESNDYSDATDATGGAANEEYNGGFNSAGEYANNGAVAVDAVGASNGGSNSDGSGKKKHRAGKGSGKLAKLGKGGGHRKASQSRDLNGYGDSSNLHRDSGGSGRHRANSDGQGRENGRGMHAMGGQGSSRSRHGGTGAKYAQSVRTDDTSYPSYARSPSYGETCTDPNGCSLDGTQPTRTRHSGSGGRHIKSVSSVEGSSTASPPLPPVGVLPANTTIPRTNSGQKTKTRHSGSTRLHDKGVDHVAGYSSGSKPPLPSGLAEPTDTHGNLTNPHNPGTFTIISTPGVPITETKNSGTPTVTHNSGVFTYTKTPSSKIVQSTKIVKVTPKKSTRTIHSTVTKITHPTHVFYTTRSTVHHVLGRPSGSTSKSKPKPSTQSRCPNPGEAGGDGVIC